MGVALPKLSPSGRDETTPDSSDAASDMAVVCVCMCVYVCVRMYLRACVSLCVCICPRWVFFFFNMRPTSSLPLSLPLGPAVDTHVESGIRSWGIVPFLDHWAWLPCLEGQADKTGLPACASQMAIHHGDSRTLAGRGKILTWQTRKKKTGWPFRCRARIVYQPPAGPISK